MPEDRFLTDVDFVAVDEYDGHTQFEMRFKSARLEVVTTTWDNPHIAGYPEYIAISPTGEVWHIPNSGLVKSFLDEAGWEYVRVPSHHEVVKVLVDGEEVAVNWGDPPEYEKFWRAELAKTDTREGTVLAAPSSIFNYMGWINSLADELVGEEYKKPLLKAAVLAELLAWWRPRTEIGVRGRVGAVRHVFNLWKKAEQSGKTHGLQVKIVWKMTGRKHAPDATGDEILEMLHIQDSALPAVLGGVIEDLAEGGEWDTLTAAWEYLWHPSAARRVLAEYICFTYVDWDGEPFSAKPCGE